MAHTTIATASQALWLTLRGYGIDADRLFRDQGVDTSRWHEQGARFEDALLDELWSSALKASGDPCLGLRIADHWHPSQLHALGYAWLVSDTLLDALSRTVRYLDVVVEGLTLRLDVSGDDCRLAIEDCSIRPQTRAESLDAFWAVLLRMCRVSAGEAFAPKRLVLRRPKPSCAAEFYRVFRCEIEFAAEEDLITFPRNDVERYLPSANKELARANEEVIYAYLRKLDSTNLKDKVRGFLLEALPQGDVSQAVAARSLNISLRTLQRRLVEEGISFKELLEDTRRQLAVDYLGDLDLPLKEIAFVLGFSEPGNFSRAFKRWTGKTPSEFRAARQGS